MAEGGKPVGRQAAGAQGAGQVARGGIEAFPGQLESAPMNADTRLGLDIDGNLHGVVRIDVLRTHEVARQVGANRHGQVIDRPEAAPNFAEVG